MTSVWEGMIAEAIERKEPWVKSYIAYKEKQKAQSYEEYFDGFTQKDEMAALINRVEELEGKLRKAGINIDDRPEEKSSSLDDFDWGNIKTDSDE